MSIYRNSFRVAAQNVTDSRKEQRIEEGKNRFGLMIRDALRKAVLQCKGDETRKPMPSPRQAFSDTFRGQRHPGDQLAELLMRMKEDGLSHFGARVFMSTGVAWVDSIYSDEAVPSLEVLAPRLVVEQGEATAAKMRAMVTRCPSDYARAADEIGDVIGLAETARQRCLLDSAVRLRPISAAR